MRGRLAAALVLSVAGCGGEPPVRFHTPGPRAFVDGRIAPPVEVEAGRARRLVLHLDGAEIASLEPDADGRFRTRLAVMPPRGRHVLEAFDPDVPGRDARVELFVDRAPDSPVDGFGFSPAGDWAITLADGRPSDDGLAAGRLELVAMHPLLAGRGSRRLSERGVSGVVGSGVEPVVAWLDGWSEGRGDLHVEVADGTGPRDGGEGGLPGVREIALSPSGNRLGVLDDGLAVWSSPFDAGGLRRVAHEADAFLFAGPAEDLVGFARAGDDGGAEALRAVFAAAPEYAPVALASRVDPVLARNPAAREVALRAHGGDLWGDLLLFGFDGAGVSSPADRVSGFEFSASGEWLVALSRADADGAGILAVSRRLPPAATFTVPGSFIAAAFDREEDHLLALTAQGDLLEIDLRASSPSAAPLAAGVIAFAALEARSALWATADGAMWVRTPDLAVLPAGTLHPTRPEVAFDHALDVVAFTSVDGDREPIRRVDLRTGAVAMFGVEARRPTPLAEGALAWAERRADAEDEGALANEDLWLYPAFPASIGGPRRVAERVAAQAPFPVRPDGRALAVLAGQPRRGERWEARALCVGVDRLVDDRGAADVTRRATFFLPDGRMVWFGPDGDEDRVLFAAPCGPS